MTDRIRVRTLVSVEVTPAAIRAAAWLVLTVAILVAVVVGGLHWLPADLISGGEK